MGHGEKSNTKARRIEIAKDLFGADGIIFLGAQFTLIFQIVIFSAPSFFGFSIAVSLLC